MRLAIVLGSSAAALEEFEAARAFLDGQGIEWRAVAVNDAIKFCPVKPYAFCTIHSKKAPKLFLEGVDTSGILMYTRRGTHEYASFVVKAKWLGTSGLYAVQIALEDLGFDGVILAGCPIDAAHGTRDPKSLMTEPDRVERYKPEWRLALPHIGERTRSMSGWTRELLGEPTPEWLKALAQPRPPAETSENASLEIAR